VSVNNISELALDLCREVNNFPDPEGLYSRENIENGLKGYWNNREELTGYLIRKGLDNFAVIRFIKRWERINGNYVRETYEEPSSTVTSMVCSGNCVTHCHR
jgi:aldehyde:ferredoxin oxidoreductase